MKSMEMLKIKDNVDLKKLKKYGFKLEPLFEQNIYNYYINDEVVLSVIEKNREIYIDILGKGIYEIDIPVVLYDLIKDDLIEKVSV